MYVCIYLLIINNTLTCLKKPKQYEKVYSENFLVLPPSASFSPLSGASFQDLCREISFPTHNQKDGLYAAADSFCSLDKVAWQYFLVSASSVSSFKIIS